jgi:hypothetical protein
MAHFIPIVIDLAVSNVVGVTISAAGISSTTAIEYYCIEYCRVLCPPAAESISEYDDQ